MSFFSSLAVELEKYQYLYSYQVIMCCFNAARGAQQIALCFPNHLSCSKLVFHSANITKCDIAQSHLRVKAFKDIFLLTSNTWEAFVHLTCCVSRGSHLKRYEFDAILFRSSLNVARVPAGRFLSKTCWTELLFWTLQEFHNPAISRTETILCFPINLCFLVGYSVDPNNNLIPPFLGGFIMLYIF